MNVNWEHVTKTDVLRALQEYDRLGPEAFFSTHGFAPTTTYDLVSGRRSISAQGNPGHRLSTRHRAAPRLG